MYLPGSASQECRDGRVLYWNDEGGTTSASRSIVTRPVRSRSRPRPNGPRASASDPKDGRAYYDASSPAVSTRSARPPLNSVNLCLDISRQDLAGDP